MTDQVFRERLLKRMDTILRLLVEQRMAGPETSTTDVIFRLLDLGLSQSETAAVIGKSTNYVGAVVSNRKKGKKARASK